MKFLCELEKSILLECEGFWGWQSLSEIKNFLQLSELSSIWGQSTGRSHAVRILQDTPLPLPPSLSSFLPSYWHFFSRSKQTHLTELNMTIIYMVFLLFPSAWAVYQKLFNHWAVQVEDPLSLPVQRAYCDLTCCIREHPGWFTTLIKDNSNDSSALLHCTGLECRGDLTVL